MSITVKITSVDKVIEVEATRLEYKFDDLSDSGFDKTNKYLIKVMFEGDIKETNKDETLKFLEWSLDTNTNVYRNVEIIVKGTGSESRRIYKLEGAYIADYIEKFGENDNDKGTYIVNLIQRKENTDKDKVKFYAE